MKIILTSFGYLHLDAHTPKAHRTEDTRKWLRDPAFNTELLDLDGRDERVNRAVLNTKSARTLIVNLFEYVDIFMVSQQEECSIAIGCAGGRHRSVALVEYLAKILREAAYLVEVRHLHVHLPRVIKEG